MPRIRRASSSSISSSGNREYSKQAPGRILYRVEWTNEESRIRQNFDSDIPFSSLRVAKSKVNYEDAVVDDESDKPALVVITPIRGVIPLQPVSLADDTVHELTSPLTDSSGGSDRDRFKSEDVAYEDIEITSVKKSKIIIYSPVLLKALRDVIEYYPGRSFTSSPVQIAEPYEVLVHHLDELQSLHRRLSEEGSQGSDDTKTTGNEKDACKQLQLLLDYLQEYMRPHIGPARTKLFGPEPMVTFADLWLLFKPGTDVYQRIKLEQFGPTLFAGVVMEVEANVYDPDQGQSSRDPKATSVSFWNLESDGERYGRSHYKTYIEPYEGARRITTLPIFPCYYRDREDGGKTRTELERRGRKTFDISRVQPKQIFYNGYQFGTRKQWYRGATIIDSSTALAKKNFSDDEDVNWSPLAHEITFTSSNSDMNSQPLGEFPYRTYHSITIKELDSLPSNHHYFLVDPMIPGFALLDKTWKLFNVEWLEELKETNSMDILVIDEVNRNIVEAVCRSQSQPWKIDSISNKGEGQVALLHGPPGVGKTYTVECIAQSAGRPLIALTIGDLLLEEDKIEARLLNWFELAEKWKAILLLDEADIFLERRATRDIQRNGIVSIFLRRIEYFRGLLFLTTNRVGHIDDAFLSRVSVVLQYDHLTDETRKKIWNGFFKKLHKDSELDLHDGHKIEIDRYAQKYVINDEAVTDLRWNGREMRNALQTAIFLASYKALKEGKSATDTVEVEKEHFKSVVTMSRKFKNYMNSITGKEEYERAKARMERNDLNQRIIT